MRRPRCCAREANIGAVAAATTTTTTTTATTALPATTSE
jgi:hypothetical protein